MARNNYTAEQIIGMLREADVRPSQGEKNGDHAGRGASRRGRWSIKMSGVHPRGIQLQSHGTRSEGKKAGDRLPDMTQINAHSANLTNLGAHKYEVRTMNIEKAMHKGAKWVSPEITVSEIAALMKKDDIGAVPVGENDRLIGMITDRDLALRVLPDGADPAKLKARDVMTKGIVYCRTDQTVEDAIHLMEDKKIRRLPVINDQKRLVGMLTLGDVSHNASRELSGELMHAIATPHA